MTPALRGERGAERSVLLSWGHGGVPSRVQLARGSDHIEPALDVFLVLRQRDLLEVDEHQRQALGNLDGFRAIAPDLTDGKAEVPGEAELGHDQAHVALGIGVDSRGQFSTGLDSRTGAGSLSVRDAVMGDRGRSAIGAEVVGSPRVYDLGRLRDQRAGGVMDLDEQSYAKPTTVSSLARNPATVPG